MDGIGVFLVILGAIVFLTFAGYLICVGVSRMSEKEKGGGLIFILGMMAGLAIVPLVASIAELSDFLDTLQRPQYYIKHPECYIQDIRQFVIPGVIAIAMLPAPICCFIKLLKNPTKLNRQIVKFILFIFIISMAGSLIGLALSADSNKSNRGECTICGEKATETFQYSEYCAEHYAKAVKWAIDDVADKDN